MFSWIACAVLLMATLYLWAGLLMNFATMHNSDAAGNGMARAFAFCNIVALFAALAALLWFASWKGTMSASAAWTLILLHPLSALACVWALFRMQDHTVRWPLVIPFFTVLAMLSIAASALPPRAP